MVVLDVYIGSTHQWFCVQVLLDTETKFEATIRSTADEEAKRTQKSLSLLKESIWIEV